MSTIFRYLKKPFLLTLAFLVTGIFLSFFVHVPKVSADPACVNGGAYILFARGSGQHFNDGEAMTFKNAVENALDSTGVTKKTWAELGNLDGADGDGDTGLGWSGVETFEYPAVAVPDWQDLALNPSSLANYMNSVNTGMNELFEHLQDRITKCPGEVIILGGYSQGADTIGTYLQYAGSQVVNKIGYVALYGDPLFTPACGQDNWWKRGDSGWCQNGILGHRSPYFPSSLESRAGSWCDDKDGMCIGDFDCGILPSDFPCSHKNIYRNYWILNSASEIAVAAKYRLQILNGEGGSNGGGGSGGTQLSPDEITEINKQNDSLDANPSLAVSSTGIVFSLHISSDKCAKIFKRNLNDSGFSFLTQISSTCNWSTAGATDIAMVPGTSATGWIALIRGNGSNCAQLSLYNFSASNTTNYGDLGECGWSKNAPPSITVDDAGNVYVAAVKGGNLWVFRRDANGVITNDGSLGIGSWSEFSGVSLATSPGGKIWAVAVKDNGDTWTFVRHTDGTWVNKGNLGLGKWSVLSQPGLVVDHDGDVTVATVKQGNGNEGAIHSYRFCSACSQWHYVGQIGTTSEWSSTGTLAMTVAPDDKVWLAAVKNDPSGTSMWSSVFTPDPNENWLGTWSSPEERGNGGWSMYASPAIAVANGGTVFLSAVKTNGDMWAFKRTSTGDWSNYGQIGGSGWVGKLP